MKNFFLIKILLTVLSMATLLNASSEREKKERETTVTNIERYIEKVAPVEYSKDKKKIGKLIYLNTKIVFGDHREELAYLMASIIHTKTGFRPNVVSNDMELLGDIQITEERMNQVAEKSKRLSFLKTKTPMQKRNFLKSHEGSIMIGMEILFLEKDKIKWKESNYYLKFYDLINAFDGNKKDNQNFIIAVMEHYKVFYKGI